ncbi:hydrolase or acyltransferase of alpha/beta superfamily [Paraburkholderia caffeinilytica]|uniref:Hydrolase (Alpha/beta fold) n=1 Tax=Paraburkholderia caffeinilytica TaxID=1761016 RepID=A0ABQ1LRM8_9BURK|nr:alpha/beta fold hydrolase [Paraburkholderia caffeinilytica]AXL53674.1 hydrolase or acyltransferase of alpha/beta superfamily [Paraburkholderia caffeinilytica]GGC27038.1 putative hydrolase (alpha/beta fold) [Paraburkholderia caffeinilytica]CAB3780022.1 2-succinyl-6-hydroxy-2, 4-cyclohexadiene-1-carboxylate synthase [Paraburkholderia caffeinilytica]
MTRVTRRFSAHGGVTLASDLAGDAAAPLVILLHGGGQTRRAWRHTANALSLRGLRVVSVDLRGHGESDWAPDGDYSLDAQIQDLRALANALPESPMLVGASLGGLIALAAVGEAAVIARSLVLVDVAPRVDAVGEARIQHFMRQHGDGFASIEEAAEAVAAYLPHRPRPADTSGLKHSLRLQHGRYYWHWDPALINSLDASPNRLAARYDAAARNVRVPTLLVRGARSELVTHESVSHLKTVIPHAESVDVASAGHMVAGDRNDAFSAALLAFIERQLQN